ncbi:hypothetical protein WME90_27330 [Sorangium sp. So ce375]|uniref:hypothetical protein n=1 Tax=Sorangium sp. So ce375 TaxID=3133306 RepID=UPI003F5BBB6C
MSSSVSSGTGGTPEETTSSSASTGGNTPVACQLGDGAPPGAPCAEEGELCDYACSNCLVECTGGVWVERCYKCPSSPPRDGEDCSTYDSVGPCSYGLQCGTSIAVCDESTRLWVVTCGNQRNGSGGGGGGGGEEGGGDAESGGGGSDDHEGGCG